METEAYKFWKDPDDGRWLLTHPKWSLMGRGRTPLGAMYSLVREAEDLVVMLRGSDDLSDGAQAMLAFAQKLVTQPTGNDGQSSSSQMFPMYVGMCASCGHPISDHGWEGCTQNCDCGGDPLVDDLAIEDSSTHHSTAHTEET